MRHDQIVWLHIVGEHGDRAGRHVDRHDLFFRPLRAGVNPSIRSEFQTAALRRVLNERRHLAVGADFPDARVFAEVEEVEIALRIGAGGVCEAKSIRNQLPVLAVNQHFRQRFITGKVLGVARRQKNRQRNRQQSKGKE